MRSRAASHGSDEDRSLEIEELSQATAGRAAEAEAEARRLAHAPLAEVSTVLARWAQLLRGRPRPEEPPATFRAAFLRSDASVLMLQSLARSERLQAVLRDPPLFAAEEAAACRPEQAILTEATTVLQLTFRRAAAPLARPLVNTAVLPEHAACGRQAEAMCELVAALKDDWVEVARSQATRAVERRIDALTYELQKVGAVSSRRALGARTARCPGGGDQGPLCRTPSVETSAAAAASASAAARRTVRGRLVAVARLCESVREAQGRAEARAAELEAVLVAFGADAGAARPATPSTAATSSSAAGPGTSRGLPEDLPGATEPPRSLRNISLGGGCRGGIDLCLQRAEPSVLLTPTLLEHIQCVPAEGAKVSNGPSRESTAASPAELTERSLAAPRGCAVAADGDAPAQVLPEALRAGLAQVAEALTADSQRAQERLASQLQQRRAQLVRGLVAQSEVEQDRLCSLAASLAKAQASPAAQAQVGPAAQAAASLEDRLTLALQEFRGLCRRAEAITCCLDPPSSGGNVLDYLSVGQQCRAKWMDGLFYDATVHRVLPGGHVVVNWLRPLPGGRPGEHGERFVTVCESGGDDSLHRIVPLADLQLHDGSSSGLHGSAMWLFNNRPPCDRQCVDCGSGKVDWAAVSFGTFVCRPCALQHKALGFDVSYVREIRGGWGWPDLDLQYLTRGGNAAFLAALDHFPTLRSASISERYRSRFAEQYRRQLDAACCGVSAPARLPAALAAQPMGENSDFVGAAEAAEIARQLRPRFEAAVQAALDAPAASQWRIGLEGLMPREPRITVRR